VLFFFYSSFEDNVGKTRTTELQTAMNFLVFDPRTVARVYFRWLFVNFGPITVKIQLL